MLIEFSMIPIGSGSSIGERLSEILKVVDSSGIPYKINPMGTVLEGNWNELFKIIKKCHMNMLKNEERIITNISIDDRKGKQYRLEQKVKSIEKRLGKKLKK
jgi:uncharacterized protein (TIGR00106 family)